MNSHILVSKGIDLALEQKKSELKGSFLRVFVKDEFLIDDAKEVISESYIATDEPKYIILAAQRFNVYAQNRLLKVIEEPPKNVFFILITESKSSLLPTIRSRLPVIVQKDQKTKSRPYVNLNRFDSKSIYEFLKEHTKVSKDEALELLEAILSEAQKGGVKLDEKLLDSFFIAPRLLLLNEKPAQVFAFLLLSIQAALKK